MPFMWRGDIYCRRFLCGVDGVMVGGKTTEELAGGVRDLPSSCKFPERDEPGMACSVDAFEGVA